MSETAKNIENMLNEVAASDKKYIIDGEYRKYELTCNQCKKDFTRNIPDDWFNGNDEIKSHNLPESVTLENAKNVFNNPSCGACQPETKKKLDDLKDHNKRIK